MLMPLAGKPGVLLQNLLNTFHKLIDKKGYLLNNNFKN
jgi:hypothetical protein